MGGMRKVGLTIKAISLFITCILLTTSISVAVENHVLNPSSDNKIPTDDQIDLSIEDREKLEKISREMIEELNNYTKDLDDVLSRASSSKEDAKELYENLSEKLMNDFLSDEELENITIETDNDTLLRLIDILSREIENFSEDFNEGINEEIEKSYQKEISLRESSLYGEEIDRETQEEESIEQINTLSIDESSKEKITSVGNESANLSKVMAFIDRFFDKNSLLKELLTKTIYKLSPIGFSDDVERKNIGKTELDDNQVGAESLGGGLSENPNPTYVETEDLSQMSAESSEETVPITSTEESYTETQDQTTTAESPSDVLSSSHLLWIETAGGIDPGEFKTAKAFGRDEESESEDSSIDYSLADRWYIYHSGDRIEIPLALHSIVDLNVLSVEKIEVIIGEEIFEVKPHFGGLDIGDVILLGILGYHLILLKFTIKALLLVGKGLLIPLILEKIYKFGWKVLSKFWKALFGITFAGLLLEMYNNFVSTLSKKVLPILGEYIDKAIDWVVEYFLPALAGWLMEKAIPAIVEFIKILPMIIYDLIRCVNIAVIKAMEIGEVLYEAIKHFSIEILGGTEFTVTMGRTVVGSKSGAERYLNIFDVMEMSPLVAYIREGCDGKYAIVNLTVKSANKTRDWLRVGIIIDDDHQSGDGNGYEHFTSKYIPTAEQAGYSEGYMEGYQQGYSDGYNAASSTETESNSASSEEATEDTSTESSSWSDEWGSSAPSGGQSSGGEQSEESENVPPVAVIDGPSSGTVGEVLTFTAEDSFDVDGAIVRYDWWYKGMWHNNLGDTIQIVFYSPIPHTKTIKVRVHDDDGDIDIATTTCYITLW